MNNSCPECGYPLNGTESSCPECGYPLNAYSQRKSHASSITIEDSRSSRRSKSPSPVIIDDEGDNEAEDILRNTLNWIKNIIIVVSVIAGVVQFIVGIVASQISAGYIFLGLISGAITILVGIITAKLIWAVGMIFINISTNVRSIKKSLRS